MDRLATCFWVSDFHTPTGFVGCARFRMFLMRKKVRENDAKVNKNKTNVNC